jgi:N-6 DNA Methylase/Eco57I restriction-modification methylase
VIAGMSGSLLSHDALDELWQRPDPAVVTFAAVKPYRHLRAWHAGIRARLGPTATARTIFDAVAEPLLRSLGFDISVVQSSSQSVAALLTTSARPVAALIAAPWIVPLRTLWRQAVRCGLAHQVRWTICVNGSAIAAFDVRRAYARRWVEFEMEVALDVDRSLGVLCTLLGAGALAGSGGGAVIERVLDHSERHRAAVRGSLRSGVHDAVLQLVSAFREVVSRTHTDSHLLDESLIVVYRLLFLLFAEARNLVPTWHPIYRDSYTIDTIVRPLHNDRSPTGVWEAFQALSRLAHRGCRAGPMRVPPFNGRLFSPACAPLAARVSLSDSVVRRAVLSLTSRASAEGRRSISYADFGVEQLGAVYEHLLDFVVSTQAPAGARMIATGRRKATGSFYTPRALTEFVVRRGLGAVVQRRTPDGILALRVVDPAMGSGAFLVSACRYLAQAYEQALIEEGTVTAADLTEQDRAGFRRAVAQRCLFGVDINPMAVQLARLSMWLATLAADKPLTFLDHRLRVGHSLIGASVADVVCRPFPGRGRRPRDLPLFPTDDFAASMESAIGVRRQLAEGPDDSLDQVRGKERTLAALESEDGPLARWREAADLWCAAWLDEGIARDRRTFGALLDHVLQRGSALPPRTLEPLLAHARGVSRSARVFNWAMEFPEVFYGDDGVEKGTSGFDVVLGNPPWDVLHETDGRDSERRLTTYARGSGQYGLQGSGHANLYQLFFERGLRLLKPGGRCALILPSGFATDQGSGRLRRHLLERTEVDTFATIDNRDGIFPIHRSLKFVLLTFNNGGKTETVPWRSGVRSAESLDCVPDRGVDPAALPVPKSTVARVSGEGLELPDIRTEMDLEILTKITVRVPASANPAGWHIHFGRELNATDDRAHFTSRGDLPIVEGKQLRPFGADAVAPRFWIERDTAATLLDPQTTFGRDRLAYRDVASPTNRQTLIAAIVPRETVTTHTVFCVKETLDKEAQQFLCGILNSYVADYLVRMRVGTHVSAAIVARLPVPRPDRRDPLFVVVADAARLLAAGWNGGTFARLNAAAARLYGLTVPEFSHVVATFPLADPHERALAVAEFLRI